MQKVCNTLRGKIKWDAAASQKAKNLQRCVSEAMKSGVGECRQYTRILVAACRLHGIPARPVGCVKKKGQGVDYDLGNTHYVAEVYIDGAGWVTVEPQGGTLGCNVVDGRPGGLLPGQILTAAQGCPEPERIADSKVIHGAEEWAKMLGDAPALHTPFMKSLRMESKPLDIQVLKGSPYAGDYSGCIPLHSAPNFLEKSYDLKKTL